MKNFLLLFFITLSVPFPVHATTSWYYPLENFSARSSDKGFGQYFDKKWYVGKTDRFPIQFTGYHAAADLEIFPNEKNQSVPVYSITDGQIIYAGSISGYGGIILENLSNTSLTAIYGHVKISSFTVKVGDTISAGTKLGVLGDAFSNETGGERKHLHFGIYKGQDSYFRGYEDSLVSLNKRWENPIDFLRNHNALDLGLAPTISPYPSPISTTNIVTPLQSSLLQKVLEFFRNFLSNL